MTDKEIIKFQQEQISLLHEENAMLKALVASLQEENAMLKERIEELEKRLGLDSTTSSKRGTSGYANHVGLSPTGRIRRFTTES